MPAAILFASPFHFVLFPISILGFITCPQDVSNTSISHAHFLWSSAYPGYNCVYILLCGFDTLVAVVKTAVSECVLLYHSFAMYLI